MSLCKDVSHCLAARISGATDAEGIVGRFGGAGEADLVFVDDVFVGFGVAGGVVDVPAEMFKEGVEEFAAELGFVVLAGFVGVEVAFETFDEIENFFWGGHDDGNRLGNF